MHAYIFILYKMVYMYIVRYLFGQFDKTISLMIMNNTQQ